MISLHGVLPSGSRGTVLGLGKQNPPLLRSIAELDGELRGQGSGKEALRPGDGDEVQESLGGEEGRSELALNQEQD